jgi:hypothetical protein
LLLANQDNVMFSKCGSWFVPPLVVPVALLLLVAVYIACR